MSADPEMVALRALVLALQQEVALLRQRSSFFIKDGELVLRQEICSALFGFLQSAHSIYEYECFQTIPNYKVFRIICPQVGSPLWVPLWVRWDQRTDGNWELIVLQASHCCSKSELLHRLCEIEDAVEQWIGAAKDDFSKFRVEFDKFLCAVREHAQHTTD